MVIVSEDWWSDCFPKVIFHTPENHHLHNNLCPMACQHFENKTFPNYKTLFGYSQLLFCLVDWGLFFTVTQMYSSESPGALSQKRKKKVREREE